MNILFFYGGSLDPRSGGTEKVIETLSKAFQRDGHSIFYVTIHGDANHESPFPYLILDKHRLSTLTSVRVRLFADFIRQNKIDVIIDNYHHNFLKYIKMVAAVKEATGVKVVNLYHTSPNGHELRWRRMDDDSSLRVPRRRAFKEYLLSRSQLAYIERVKTKRALKYRLKHYDKVVLLSGRFIPETVALCGAEFADKLIAIPNAVGSLMDTPQREPKRNELLWVGGMRAMKKPEKALKIWLDLQGQFPEWSINFLGYGELLEPMRALATGKAERCHFLGFQDPKPYYQGAKIFLMTSDYEGLPLVLVEAQRSGVVPFAFDNFASLPDIRALGLGSPRSGTAPLCL